MKIFHGVIEIGGQIGMFCKGLKRAGHLAAGFNFMPNFLDYRSHLITQPLPGIQASFRHMLHFFDLFHFHLSVTLFPDALDLPFIHRHGKKMIVHHWGSDVRFHDQARANNPYVYTGNSASNADIHRQLKLLGKWMSQSIVQDHEVLAYVQPYFEKVHVLPIAIELERFPFSPAERRADRPPLIIHAPTHPRFKGTEAIERALDTLRPRYKFEYKRIEQTPHREAAKLLRSADIVIDQIRCGSHGLLAVEAMALGKPVISYIRDDLVPTFPPSLPIVNANPDTLASRLSRLLDNREQWPALGKAGRAYAKRYHALDVILPKLLKIYGGL